MEWRNKATISTSSSCSVRKCTSFHRKSDHLYLVIVTVLLFCVYLCVMQQMDGMQERRNDTRDFLSQDGERVTIAKGQQEEEVRVR